MHKYVTSVLCDKKSVATGDRVASSVSQRGNDGSGSKSRSQINVF